MKKVKASTADAEVYFSSILVFGSPAIKTPNIFTPYMVPPPEFGKLLYIYMYISENEKCASAVRSTSNDFFIKTQLCKLRVILRSRVHIYIYITIPPCMYMYAMVSYALSFSGMTSLPRAGCYQPRCSRKRACPARAFLRAHTRPGPAASKAIGF